jgi:RNA-directed DNA polymerase
VTTDRPQNYPNAAFDFLGYRFRSRKSKNKNGKYFTGFLPAVSDKAKKGHSGKDEGIDASRNW